MNALLIKTGDGLGANLFAAARKRSNGSCHAAAACRTVNSANYGQRNWDKSMPAELSFIPVLSSLVDPKRQVIIKCVQIRIDENPYIEIGYDPMIGPDKLTMPIPQHLRFLVEGKPERAVPRLLFKSDAYNELAKIFVKARVATGVLRITVDSGEHGLKYAAGFIERAGISGVSESPYQALREILSACVKLPAWDDMAKAFSEPVHKICFYLDVQAARDLFANTGTVFDTQPAGEILFVEREVRS